MSRELQGAFLRRHRNHTDESARSCNGDTTRTISSARSLADTDHRTSTIPGIPAQALNAILREFWYSIVLAAKHSDSNGPHQQTTVDLISEKKNDTGTLRRFISLEGKVVQGLPIDGDTPEIARTADGDAWSDLPYFRAELFDAFLSAPPPTEDVDWLISTHLLYIDLYTWIAVRNVIKFNARYTQDYLGEDQFVAECCG